MQPYLEQGVAIDLGTGDGSYVIKSARANPDKFFIGIDAAAENLCQNSHKAAKKPSKGGLANAMFVNANVESLPEELQGVASQVTIHLPWGSLLRAVALPEVKVLQNIAKLCRPGASIKVIFGYELDNEKNTIEDLGLPLLTPEYLQSVLKPAYREAGFDVNWRYLAQKELKQLPTAWAKKLAFGKKRQFIEIRGQLV